jgi:hypothetical protein
MTSLNKRLIFGTLVTILFSGCSNVYFSDHIVGHGKITTLSYDATKRASTILYKRVDSNLSTKISNLIDIEIIKLNKLQTLKDKKECNNKCDDIIERISRLNALYYRPIILAENPPQSTKNINFNLGADVYNKVDTNISLSSKNIKMFDVSGYNLMLRDSLYRLNEALIINENMSMKDYKEMFNKVLQSSVDIAKYLGKSINQDNNRSK